MNGDGKCSLRPWSAGQNDEETLMSESVDQSNMPYQRKQQDGSHERNVILKKIYKDFGSLSMSNKNPYGMTYSKSSFPGPHKRPKAESLSRMAICAKYEPYKPKGTPRYSNIDKFIDNLNLACAALPKPMIEDFGRARPHTVAVLSQPQREAMMIKVLRSKPSPTELNGGEQQEDQAVSKEDYERAKSPLESGHVSAPRVTQIKVCASAEMGLWKDAGELNRDCERQATKLSSDNDSFESKKMEVVRAATMLQSRYRGYKVRRSQPLKYMLMIGNAKSKLEELKQQLNTWKIAVWFPTDYPERLAMTENVMNLLMELDSIQV